MSHDPPLLCDLKAVIADRESQIASMRQDIIRQQAEIERLKVENQQLRERQGLLDLRNLPQWKVKITPEALK